MNRRVVMPTGTSGIGRDHARICGGMYRGGYTANKNIN
jgi:hypothetical protein